MCAEPAVHSGATEASQSVLIERAGDEDPLLSIVILSWNRRDDLRTTLGHVSRDPYALREIIVVDNGSTDGSAAMVHRLFPQVRVLESPRNVGIEGLNVGIRAARGEVILLLDDDSYPAGDALSQLAAAFRDDPRLGIAACRIEGPPGWWEQAWPWPSAGPAADVPTFIGCGAAIRRTALERAGVFDPAFFLYQNETDLAARVMDAGYAVRYFPTIRFVHAVSQINRANRRQDYYGVRNVLWIIWKYFPRTEAARLTARVVCESIAYCLLRRDAGRLWTVLRGMAAAVRGWPTTQRGPTLSHPTRKRVLVYLDRWYPPAWTWLRARLQGWL